MPKFFIKSEQIKDEEIVVIGQDVNHIKNVLRKVQGEEIIICNADNKKDYLCEVKEIEDKKIVCKIKKEMDTTAESNINVTIMQGLPKSNKMELIIQKSVELGVTEIIPVEMERSIVKLSNKDHSKKLERWQKISEVAAKQCGRNIIPVIKPIINTKNICNLIQRYDIVLIAYENEKNTTLKQELKRIAEKYKNKEIKIAILIGPEGGISEKEIELLSENGAITVSLGKRILRTETVALNILSIIMYELEN